MADRPPGVEKMAVSNDPVVSQQSMKESTKDEADLRATQSSSKMDAPKKKTFKITSVTKSSSQRGGSTDLTLDNDGDSIDDLDETIDSHTEDLSSEMYDCSKATDLDGQDALLTPEEVIKEKPGRFKVVKIDTKEPFRRGRWLCYDFPDAPEKAEPKQDESISAGSAANSVFYGQQADDPSKNPLLAGASGTVPSHPQNLVPADSVAGSGKGPADSSQSKQSAASQPGMAQMSSQAGQNIQNTPYSNHVAQSMPAYSKANALPYSSQGGQQVPAYSIQGLGPGQTAPSAQSGQPLRGGMSAPNLPQQQTGGQTKTSQSAVGTGTISYPTTQQQPQQPQQQPAPQAASIPPNAHSQPAPASGSAPAPQSQLPGAMQRGEYMNSAAQAMGQPLPPQQSAQQQQQQPSVYDASAQSSGAAYGMVSSASSGPPQQNHQSAMATSTTDIPVDGGNVGDPNMSAASMPASVSQGTLRSMEGSELEDSVASLGQGLEPLQIAVGGITNANPEDDMTTEEAGSSTVAIDNKIEQAMDLVKSHLMYAVREEVEVLKEQIKELMERLTQLEYENNILRAAATPDTLAKLTPTTQPSQQPPPSSSS